MRFKADLQLCEAASPGNAEAIAKLAAAREGWPEAIKRALHAEKIISATQLGRLSDLVNRYKQNSDACGTCRYKKETHLYQRIREEQEAKIEAQNALKQLTTAYELACAELAKEKQQLCLLNQDYCDCVCEKCDYGNGTVAED